MKFIKTMCGNCPFRADGKAIVLRPGRLEDIAAHLLESDYNTFSCHKTTGQERSKEALCAGALGYSYKRGMIAVATRMGLAMGDITVDDLKTLSEHVIENAEDAEYE